MFYPDDEAELREMFLTMARKKQSELTADDVPQITIDRL